MKTTLRRIGIAILLTVSAAPAFAQSADEIIEKHLAASGGREALGKLTSRVSTGSISLTTPAGDLQGTIEADAKAPNKTRTVIKIDATALGAGQIVQEQRFDGTSAYVIDSIQGNRQITGAQLDALRTSAAFPSLFLDYKARGVQLMLSGEENVSDKPAYVLVVTSNTDAPAARAFIDKDSLMLVRISMKLNVPQLGTEIEQVVDYSDFRDVDGIKLPFVTRSTNQVQTVTTRLASIKHNVAIDDATFSPPATQ